MTHEGRSSDAEPRDGGMSGYYGPDPEDDAPALESAVIIGILLGIAVIILIVTG